MSRTTNIEISERGHETVVEVVTNEAAAFSLQIDPVKFPDPVLLEKVTKLERIVEQQRAELIGAGNHLAFATKALNAEKAAHAESKKAARRRKR